ncbi:hypothetical protein AB0I35_20290 [Nocardia sp. NPDC050378]
MNVLFVVAAVIAVLRGVSNQAPTGERRLDILGAVFARRHRTGARGHRHR